MNTLFCYDMIELESGELLSLCGNFDGPWYRVRLCFYLRKKASRFIGGKSYQKVRYETGYLIPTCKKLLDLPGEQHFLVHSSQITRIYRTSKAFTGLEDPYSTQCQHLIDLLYDTCDIDRDKHGLSGSGAVNSITPTSDFDWVIHNRDPTAVKEFILSNTCFRRELTFDMEHVYRKYKKFEGLNHVDLDKLFDDRWKYFRFQDLRISMSFVDPLMRTDDFLDAQTSGEPITMKGTVIENTGCYHMPYIIPVSCDNTIHLVLTWLFLYNGAFGEGDLIQFSGKKCIVGGKQYILVESSQDYIRKLTPEGGTS